MFSLSFKNGVSPEMMDEFKVPPVIMNASCLDQNCAALFLIDPVYEEFYNLTINVTVSAEDCSNSTVKMTSGFISKRIITGFVKSYNFPRLTLHVFNPSPSYYTKE